MAHFAELKDNFVQRIIVVNNEVLGNAEGLTGEAIGVAFCKSIYGADTEWKQTSYNNNFRTRYAGAGMIYDPVKDEFAFPTE
jgi:hypothetical protein